jgi:hypothetical protein
VCTPGTSLSFTNDGQLSITSPAGSAGVVDVRVKTAAGTSPITGHDQFTYTSTAPGTVFDWTVDFDTNCTGGCPAAGTQVTLPIMANIFNSSSIGSYLSDSYWDYVANVQCFPYYPGGIPTNCTPTTEKMIQIVAGGKTGNGLQITYKAGSIGYNGSCCGQNPQLGLSFSAAFNVMDVQWDEYLVPGFSLFNQNDNVNYSITKHGMLIGFSSNGNLPSSQHQPMIYGEYNGGSITDRGALEWISMGDGGVNAVTVENGGYCLDIVPGNWYHFELQMALGPNGWNRGWVTVPNGTKYQYSNWYSSLSVDSCPGGLGGQASAYQNSASSSTDPISTTNTTTINNLTNNAGNRRLYIDNHYGGGASNQAARVDSYVIYDNIRVIGSNR